MMSQIKNDTLDLYWECNKDFFKYTSSVFLENCDRDYKKVEYREKKALKGFVYYKEQEDILLIFETHFKTLNKWAFYKTIKPLLEGKKHVVFSTHPLHTKILKFYEKIGAVYIGNTDTGNLIYTLSLKGD